MFESVASGRSTLTFVTSPLLATIALLIAPNLAPTAQAATLKLGDLRFDAVSGDFAITGGSRNADFYTIEQAVYGPNVNLFMSIRGFRALFEDGYVGIRVQSIVRNLTGTPWIFFDHELQETPGRPSPEEDGLSFAQGYTSIRPFTSNLLPVADEVTDVRDFVNFSGGVVAPGEVVTFVYAITDNSPESQFYLLQRPNFMPGGGGSFVTPPPPPPPPPPLVVPIPPVVVIPPPPPPPVPEPSTPPPVSEPSVPPPPPPPTQGNTEAVPEPSTLLGILAAATGGAWLKRRRARSPD